MKPSLVPSRWPTGQDWIWPKDHVILLASRRQTWRHRSYIIISTRTLSCGGIYEWPARLVSIILSLRLHSRSLLLPQSMQSLPNFLPFSCCIPALSGAASSSSLYLQSAFGMGVDTTLKSLVESMYFSSIILGDLFWHGNTGLSVNWKRSARN